MEKKMIKKFFKKLGAVYAKQKYYQFFSYLQYKKGFKIFQKTDGQRFAVKIKDRYPCLNDRTKSAGFDKHYIYHTAWAARKLKEINPTEHIDIASLLYFSTLVSAFIPIRFYDYRPANISLSSLTSGHADITELPFDDNSVISLSCMHVVEHIGLGRYGDPIDIDGDLKAIAELKRVVTRGGGLIVRGSYR